MKMMLVIACLMPLLPSKEEDDESKERLKQMVYRGAVCSKGESYNNSEQRGSTTNLPEVQLKSEYEQLRLRLNLFADLNKRLLEENKHLESVNNELRQRVQIENQSTSSAHVPGEEDARSWLMDIGNLPIAQLPQQQQVFYPRQTSDVLIEDQPLNNGSPLR